MTVGWSPIAHSRQTGVVQVAGQPPPSAMNSAAVSDSRLASVCTRDHRRGQIGLLRIEHGELVDLARARVASGRYRGWPLRHLRRARAACIALASACRARKRIRDVLERGDHGRAILRLGLFERRLGRLLLVIEREAVEDRRGRARGQRVKSGAGRKALRKVVGGRAAVGRQHDIGQAGPRSRPRPARSPNACWLPPPAHRAAGRRACPAG